MALTRDQILGAQDLETREVHVPEWADPVTGDDVVYVRALTGKERDAWEASLMQIRGKASVPNPANMRAKMVVRSLVDAEGKRLFTDADTNPLGDHSAQVLDRLFELICEMSGISNNAVEEAEGNSDAAPSGVSTSNSHATLAAL